MPDAIRSTISTDCGLEAFPLSHDELPSKAFRYRLSN